MKIHISIYICLFLCHHGVQAQHVPHLSFWSRFSLSQPFSEKWRGEAEIQHRRQNDYAQQTKDVFDESLLTSARTWLHYQHKEDLGFSLSPFSYYWHNRIILSENDKPSPRIKEMRFAFAADMKHEVIKRIWLLDRTSFEYRDFQHTNKDFIRMRNRLGLRFDINKKWNVSFYDEVFLNLKGAAPTNSFDHDRLAFLINYKPNKFLRFEMGYLFITRLQSEAEEFLHENDFLLHIYCTLPQKEKEQKLSKT